MDPQAGGPSLGTASTPIRVGTVAAAATESRSRAPSPRLSSPGLHALAGRPPQPQPWGGVVRHLPPCFPWKGRLPGGAARTGALTRPLTVAAFSTWPSALSMGLCDLPTPPNS